LNTPVAAGGALGPVGEGGPAVNFESIALLKFFAHRLPFAKSAMPFKSRSLKNFASGSTRQLRHSCQVIGACGHAVQNTGRQPDDDALELEHRAGLGSSFLRITRPASARHFCKSPGA
jgi:hypothetical protein